MFYFMNIMKLLRGSVSSIGDGLKKANTTANSAAAAHKVAPTIQHIANKNHAWSEPC